MFLTVKKWTLLYIMMLLAVFGGFALILRQGSGMQAVSASAEATDPPPVLVIDPGHGGEDGGATGEDGTVEAGINLSLSLRMEEIAAFLGVETVMTRREDISLHDSGLSTFRARKTSDLVNRTAIANSVPEGVLISIHQNKLPGYPTVHGAQVFYNAVPGSEMLAAAVQEELNIHINDGSAKATKAADSGIYLLQHTTCPGILVECGFLSNPEETDLLKSGEYQTKLAVTILAAALSHLSAPQ